MSYLFIKIKNLFKEEKVCIIFIKNIKFKKTKKTFLVGFFGWVFYCQPCFRCHSQNFTVAEILNVHTHTHTPIFLILDVEEDEKLTAGSWGRLLKHCVVTNMSSIPSNRNNCIRVLQ